MNISCITIMEHDVRAYSCIRMNQTASPESSTLYAEYTAVSFPWLIDRSQSRMDVGGGYHHRWIFGFLASSNVLSVGLVQEIPELYLEAKQGHE
jgi:hypothetical protein